MKVKLSKTTAIASIMLGAMAVLPLNLVAAEEDSYHFVASSYSMDKLLDNDINSGANPASLKTVGVRQLNNVCPGQSTVGSGPITGDQITKPEETFLRLQLTADDTTTCYNDSEFFLGQSLYLDQTSLDAAVARNDIRVFQPGKVLTGKVRFSHNMEDKTAIGNAGFIGQSWELKTVTIGGHTFHLPQYLAIGFTYLPTVVSQQGTTPAGFYGAVADFSTNYFNLFPLPSTFDYAQFNTYKVEWEVGNIFNFYIDGQLIKTVDATQMRTTNEAAAVTAWVDNNDFSQGFNVTGTGVKFTQTEYTDVRSLSVRSISDESED